MTGRKSENKCPNGKSRTGRTLRQTRIVFNTDRRLGLDVKQTSNTSTASANKRRKRCTDRKDHTKCEIVTLDDSFEDKTDDTVDNAIDNRVDEPMSESPVLVVSDSDSECADNDIDMCLNDSVFSLPLALKLDLIKECNENLITVPALKSRKDVQKDCLALGLQLDIDEDIDDESDDEYTPCGPEYEVESIYDSGVDVDKNIITYLVKWKNWAQEFNTWEPIHNLRECKALVDEFRHIRSLKNTDLMDCYHNFYKLKAVIEDVCEKKLDTDVMIAVLIAFNDISLKDFNYTKSHINRLRGELRDQYLVKMDKLSEIKKTDKRVDEMDKLFTRLMEKLNLKKRFKNFDNFNDFYVRRKQTQQSLKRWEKEMNSIIENQNEGLAIKIENYIDCEVPPHDFKYIAKCETSDEGIIICDDPPLYCEECDDCETQQNGCCVSSNQSIIGYNKHSLLDSRKARNVAIYECNRKCNCNENCINRVVQKGRKHKIAIFRTDDNKGWGVRALEPIPKGSFVMEYIGEIITVHEADRRGQEYDAAGITYLFDLDYNDEVEGYKYTLDATKCGNASHFVNHSCDPNIDTRVVWINNLDPFMPHIALFAIKHIKMNEELTFDYKINVQRLSNVTDSSVTSEVSFDSGIDGSTSVSAETREEQNLAVTCRCGASNCRKVLYNLPPL